MTTNERGNKPLLRFKFKGESIRSGRILYDDLSLFVTNISRAIERLVNVISTGESLKRGRPQKILKIISSLEIVSVRKGSFNIGLDLRRNGQVFPGWDLGEQSINILVNGLKAIDKNCDLPEEFDASVMIALREAGRITERGVDNITINSHSTYGNIRTVYTRPMREKIIKRLNKYEQSYAIIEGRLLELDAKEDKLRCRIEPTIGEPTPCKFDEGLTEQVINLIRNFVQARGEATLDANNKIVFFYIKDLEPIEAISEQKGIAPLSSFWKSRSFDELAEAQGVHPIENLDALSKDWPEDADFDSFLDAVRSKRA